MSSVARERSESAIMRVTLDRENLMKNHKIANENYVMDVAYTLQYTRWLLSILGVWPGLKRDSKKWQNWGSKILMTLCFSLLAFIVIPSGLHMILREKNRLVTLMLFGPVGFAFANVLKYCTLMFHREILKSCMEHLEFDWMQIETKNDREIMTRNVNVGRKLTVISAIFMYTGGLSYHTIMPLWRGSEINELNETIRPLVYPGYDMFVDPQKSPIYEMIFYTHCFSSFVMYTITTAACNLAATFVAHACGQIEITMSRLESLFENIDESNKVPDNRLGFVVTSHVRLLR
uniref:Odorant receptor n=1 Tax=Campoletis chlorideae TaxID=219166 RepID=A0A346D467_9HYME|nr:odorant receptor [Campoletis chlorideae]